MRENIFLRKFKLINLSNQTNIVSEILKYNINESIIVAEKNVVLDNKKKITKYFLMKLNITKQMKK